MFTREQYPQRFLDLGLSESQIEGLRAVLDEMMTYASQMANTCEQELLKSRGPTNHTHKLERDRTYYEGKADGFNAFDRFLRGDLDAHDEFDD